MDARRLSLIEVIAACWIVAACGPEPTPLPVVVLTATPLPQSVQSPTSTVTDSIVEYVADPVGAEILAAAFATASEMPIIQIAAVPQLSGDPSQIIISSSPFDAGQPLLTPFLYGLALDSTDLLPESAEVAQALLDYLRLLAAEARDSVRLTEAQRGIRQSLANAGYPDGILISINYAIPALVQELAAAGIEVIETSSQPAQLQVIFSDAQRQAAAAAYGEANLIYGYPLPLYYAASPGLQVTIGSSGLPVIANGL